MRWTLAVNVVVVMLALSISPVRAQHLTLLHAWDFRGGTGNDIVDSIGGILATLQKESSAPLPTRSATGVVMVGNSGAGGYIELSLGAVTLGGAMTVEADIKWNSFNHYSRVFDCANPVSSNAIVVTNVQSTGQLKWTMWDGNVQQQALLSGSSDDLALGVRYHIVTTIAGSTMRTYINGVMKAEITSGHEPTSMARSKCYIGKSNQLNNSFFAGEVSSLKLYSGAMTQADVTAAYEANFPFLEFYWDFRGGSGTTVTDSIGGIVATLMRGTSGDSSVVGALPTRTATGVVMVGTGATSSTSNAGGYIDLDAVILGGPMTVELVVKCNSAFNFYSRFFACGNGNDDNIIVNNNAAIGQLTWDVRQGNTPKPIFSFNYTDLTIGIRHHIVTTVAGTTMRSYINSMLKGEGTNGHEPVSMTRRNCYIGKSNSDGDGYLNGEVSSLKLYSGAMTQADVTAAYEANFPFLEFYWDFRGGSGTTVTDSIGGIVATLMRGTSDDGTVVGALPTRTITGVVMLGTGPTVSTSNAGGYIDLNLGAVIFGGPITVEGMLMWNGVFNFKSRLLGCGNGRDDNIVVGNSDAAGELRWSVRQGTTSKAINSGSTHLTAGVRYHIVTTVSGTTMRSYVNAVLMREGTNGHEPVSMKRRNCYIGKSNFDGDGYLLGEVSSLKLYSGAMTQLQVVAAYTLALASLTTLTTAPTTAPTLARTPEPTRAPTRAPTPAPTTAPTTGPTAAPTSALGECFATSSTVPIDLPEYSGARPNSIVVNSLSAAACFSGTTATALSIACTTDTPLRTSVTPLSAQIGSRDANPLATFTLDATADATNEGPSVPFVVTCRIEEMPARGTITFRGKVLRVRQPSIGGLCLDYSDDNCATIGTAAIVASIVSSGGNNVTLYAAEVLPGLTFDSSTKVYVNGTLCIVNGIGSGGRRISFNTPPVEVVGEGYREIKLVNEATAADTATGALCWGEHCVHNRCSSKSGSLCPSLPLNQRGIFFTRTCVGTNRKGSAFAPPWDPHCRSTNGDEAAEHCSWGSGQTCKQCPAGCRCPGGDRCWLLQGYWIANIESKEEPIPCKPAAEAAARCPGFNELTGTMACGLNHDGFMCEGCASGFYRIGGDCERCPSTEVTRAIAVPVVANGILAAILFIILMGVTFLLLYAGEYTRRADGVMPTSVRDTLVASAMAASSVTLYAIKTLQTVALSLQVARNPLPGFFTAVLRATGVVLLNMPEVHFDCLGKSGAYWGDMSVMSVHIALAAAHFMLSLRYVVPMKYRSCGIARTEDGAPVPLADGASRSARVVRAVVLFVAEKAQPYAMMGASMLLSVVDPIVFSRAHSILHCISTPYGWRLKANADFVCYEDEHSKALVLAIATIAIACASFCWRVLLTWWVFMRRAPSVEARAPSGEGGEVGDGDDAEVEEDANEAALPAPRKKCEDALYQVGLDPHCMRCRAGVVPESKALNVVFHLTKNADGKVEAFGNLVDGSVKPHLYWFLLLQSAVNSALGLIGGIFGGNQAVGAAAGAFLAAALSIAVLVGFGTIAMAILPFRSRIRDQWKTYVLIGTVSVASLSQALAFFLSLRTGVHSEAYEIFCLRLAYVVVTGCAVLCASLVCSYFSALGVHQLVRYAAKRLRDVVRCAPIRSTCVAAAEEEGDGRAELELRDIGGDCVPTQFNLPSDDMECGQNPLAHREKRAPNTVVEQENPLRAGGCSPIEDDVPRPLVEGTNPLLCSSAASPDALFSATRFGVELVASPVSHAVRSSPIGARVSMRIDADDADGAVTHYCGDEEWQAATRTSAAASSGAAATDVALAAEAEAHERTEEHVLMRPVSMRADANGLVYSRPEFVAHYGGDDEWQAAKRTTNPLRNTRTPDDLFAADASAAVGKHTTNPMHRAAEAGGTVPPDAPAVADQPNPLHRGGTSPDELFSPNDGRMPFEAQHANPLRRSVSGENWESRVAQNHKCT